MAGLFLLALISLSIAQPIFDTPGNLGPKINTSAYEADPFWDGPRKRLYFVSARDGDEDIWYSDWTDSVWADAQKLGPEINASSRIDHSPSVSPDGQTLYFVRFPWNIYASSWDSSTMNWGSPVVLPCPVNSPGTEFSAKISPDAKTLFFYSTLGSCDSLQQSGLLYSVFDSASGWSRPQGLGPNVNAGGGEQYPSITGGGDWLYFERGVSDGISIFVSPWTGISWGPAFDLRSQIGERAGRPHIVPSGDSLFFSSGGVLGGFGSSDIFVMERSPLAVNEEGHSNRPDDFELHQNIPNPFNGQTLISFFVSRRMDEKIDLTIYNLLGKPVQHLLKNSTAKGEVRLIWDGLDETGKEVSSGIYLYELRVGNQRIVKKAVFIK